MKISGKLIPLFSCLLFLCSVSHSGLTKKEQLNLLSHYNNNASLVEDRLKLVGSSSWLAASTVINYGIWYGLCKSSELISAVASPSDLSGTKQNKLKKINAYFCHSVAAAITSTEVALAGHISPWPLEQMYWWQPLRFAGTAYSIYLASTKEKSYPGSVPTITGTYFTHEVVTRTASAAHTIKAFRHRCSYSLKPEVFTRDEYALLKATTHLIVRAIIYYTLRAHGFSVNAAVTAYVVYFLFIESKNHLSASDSASTFAVEVPEARAEEAFAAAAAAATDGTMALAISATFATGLPNDFVMYAGAITMAFDLYKIHLSSEAINDGVLTKEKQLFAAGASLAGAAGTGAGLMIVMGLLISETQNPDSNHLLLYTNIALIPALTIALINGVSNNAVFGCSLEESFSETVRIQWQKFYAPLDYLYTLFH